MKMKCEYCGSFISDTEDICPNCGAVNKNMVRNGRGVPQTINELKEWCSERNMPLDKLRFFIGIDCKEAKCFGIYKNALGHIVVYKNKSDGTRSIRYEGTDEAYAVNELHMKLKEEIQRQVALGNIRPKHYEHTKDSSKQKSTKKKNPDFSAMLLIMVGVILAIGIPFVLIRSNTAYDNNEAYSNNYYSYEENYYYHSSSGDWYRFNDTELSWDDVDTPAWSFDAETTYQSSYKEFKGDYGETYSYRSDTDFYDDYVDSDSGSGSDDDWDSDYDYDYSGWDSDSTDWDSDW